MVIAAVVVEDLFHLSFERFKDVIAGCLGKIDEGLTNLSRLDVVVVDTITSSYHLDDVLGELYSLIRSVLIERSFPLLPLSVLLQGFNRDILHWDYCFASSEEMLRHERYDYRTFHKIVLPIGQSSPSQPGSAYSNDHNSYKVTALGGTFDHIHDGHKILLSMASFLTSSRLIVGLTAEELLVKKRYKDELQSFEKRRASVIHFVNAFKPELRVEIIPLRDICGPTGTVPEIEALVVSRETIQGGELVNKTRKEKGMKELEIHIVNVLGGEETDGWGEKMSSTDIRRMIHEGKTKI
ncbi:hypothetical protein KAFR_0C06450 [Kazachstania africana CBS 2517]|uniref:Cytidyltransferase-like domain-containing protein n=1 Tax=Kazachstania africana (strain ATCC 22294 / BCRC 22015 / CBS 2517 / CECT 1963 / NBRC 1671 / NRRL Y-8276) TaxID=1071382 RepID=H2ATE1_KAZAF|nr:hypothetical protein KAFR_0C06450 [Kazachstania africana CBS 2517]CCF57641.1 hypothetical protein KAFR_0C06450 [Kazachstania africana CBS 2517]